MKQRVFAGLIVLFYCNSLWAGRGHWVGNGGDSLALSIVQMARSIQERIQSLNSTCQTQLPFDVQSLNDVLERVRIETTPEVLALPEGKKLVFKEAINNPESVEIVFNREAFQRSKKKEELVVHELLGLLHVADHQYATTDRIFGLLSDTVCTESSDAGHAAPAEWVPHYVPIQTDMDINGVIYLNTGVDNNIYRYSSIKKEYLPPLQTQGPTRLFTVAPKGNFIFLVPDDLNIHKLDIKSSKENRLVYVDFENFVGDKARSIDKIVATTDTDIIVLSGGKGSWNHGGVFDDKGRFRGDLRLVEPMLGSARAPMGRGLYFISGFSSPDLHMIPGHIVNFKAQELVVRSPYFSDYYLAAPVSASGNFIATGSGHIFSNGKMEFVTKLDTPFDFGTWTNSNLVVARSAPQGFTLKGYSSKNWSPIFEFKQNEGSVVAIHGFEDEVFWFWVTPNGRLEVSHEPVN